MFKEDVQKEKDHIVNDLINLIKYRSVEGEVKPNMPFGEGVHEALTYILNRAREFDLESQNFAGYAGHVDAGKGEYTVGVLCHVDVVPEGEGWNLNPFGGEISDGKIYGRGATDDKGPIIASMYAMKILKEKGLIPEDKKVRLIIGTNEETDWKCIKYYKEYEKAPNIGFTPDGSFPVIYGEKGIVDIELTSDLKIDKDMPISLVSITGGEAINSVPSKACLILGCDSYFKEKIETELMLFCKEEKIRGIINCDKKLIKIEFHGVAAHGATPEKGVNAISYGIKFLGRFNELIDKRKFIDEYNRLISTFYNGENINCNFEDEDSGKFTFNVGLIELNSDEVSMKINIRYPINNEYYDIIDGIRNGFKYSCFKIKVITHLRPICFSKESPLINKLLKVYRRCTGDYETEPMTTGGGTYARAMDNIVAFGPGFPSEQGTAHKPNEFIKIDRLMQLTEMYAEAIYELLQ